MSSKRFHGENGRFIYLLGMVLHQQYISEMCPTASLLLFTAAWRLLLARCYTTIESEQRCASQRWLWRASTRLEENHFCGLALEDNRNMEWPEHSVGHGGGWREGLSSVHCSAFALQVRELSEGHTCQCEGYSACCPHSVCLLHVRHCDSF